MSKELRIALIGNPNSGKTTLYNVLTGRSEKVGNWAGVTVDSKAWPLKKQFTSHEIVAVDLPGAYSMSPFTNEESITKQYILNEKVDAIINIVDGTNLSRSLFFTTQLLELGIPVVVALNKHDLNVKKGTVIQVDELAKLLQCPVVETVSTNSNDENLKKVVQVAQEVIGTNQSAPYHQDKIDMRDKDAIIQADRDRFTFVNALVSKVETRQIDVTQRNSQDTIDAILAHKWFGIAFFALVMWFVFSMSQTHVGPVIADYLVALIESFGGFVGELVAGASPFLQALVVDGIVGGVGAVVGFLPLVMVMYFLIALLEDCGYMARVAVVMDRFFKKVGLSGKSIIPMIIGTGCAIPGIMASRTIKNERERRTTAMLTPFMPCGAKLPVIALFAGVFFKDESWVGTLMYFMGIFLILIGAIIVQNITGHRHRKSFFIIELPEYKIPSFKRAFFSMMERAKSFIIKAGTIILLCNIIVQVMQTFNWQLQVVEAGMENTSILAAVAQPISILFIPLGFGVWQLTAAAVTGFIAKENVVGTLAVVYGITNFIDVDALAVVGGQNEIAAVFGLTSASALAYLMFNLFTPPCFAAIGAMNSEMRNRKWLIGGVALQLAFGYIVGYFVYQGGTFMTTGHFGDAFIPGLVVVVAMIGYIVYLMKKGRNQGVE